MTLVVDKLEELARRRASGELICASDSIEVHVYFQHGRIAWATDSARPLVFTRRLLETAQIDVEIFREILESCRRERRPLGETLIAWGVATREEVLHALSHQIRLAISLLRDSDPVQTLFLNRSSQFSDYDAELTFAVAELLGAAPERSERPPSISVRPPREPNMVSSQAMRLRSSIDALEWVESLEHTAVVESIPTPVETSRVPAQLVEQTLLDGAELVALRMSTTTLAGVALTSTKSLWCLVKAGVTIGAIVATLESLAADREPPSRAASLGSGDVWTAGDGEAAVVRTLREFIDRAPELRAVFVAEPSTNRAPYGVGRAGTSPEQTSSLVARRASGLAFPDSLDAGALADVDADGLSSRRTMTAERDVCLFAAEIRSEGRSRFVWLVLDRDCSKGLGWGYLTSLSRELVRALRGAPS